MFLGRETSRITVSYLKRLTNAALGRLQVFRMYGGIGMSASSLHRESTDSLIYSYVAGFHLGETRGGICPLAAISPTLPLTPHPSPLEDWYGQCASIKLQGVCPPPPLPRNLKSCPLHDISKQRPDQHILTSNTHTLYLMCQLDSSCDWG